MARRLRRKVFGWLTLVSVALLAVTLVLIIWGLTITPYGRHLSVTDGFHIGMWRLNSGIDIRLVFFNDTKLGPYRGSLISIVDNEENAFPPRVRERMWGDSCGVYWRYFRWERGTWGPRDAAGMREPVLWTLMVSVWYPVVLFSVLPVAWSCRRQYLNFTEKRRADRLRRGQCPRCAYDLTGNTSGVCPECGARR